MSPSAPPSWSGSAPSLLTTFAALCRRLVSAPCSTRASVPQTWPPENPSASPCRPSSAGTSPARRRSAQMWSEWSVGTSRDRFVRITLMTSSLRHHRRCLRMRNATLFRGRIAEKFRAWNVVTQRGSPVGTSQSPPVRLTTCLRCRPPVAAGMKHQRKTVGMSRQRSVGTSHGRSVEPWPPPGSPARAW